MKHLHNNLRTAIAISAVVLAAGLAAPSAHADEWNKRTVLTVNEPIQIQDAVLQPGQYVLKLLDSQSDRHIVQITNSRENHVIATILAIPTQRLEPTGSTLFTFYETPAGTAKAMRDWYYPGDLIGQQFLRPKHPYLMAAAAPPPAPAPAAPPVAPPEAAPVPAPEVEQPAPTPAPAPEPAPVEQAPPPAPAPAPPAELPHTSSPYPTIALFGLGLLALGGLLRLRRLPLR
jgi:LPXTG-motif cell wall-anchored protein